MLRHVGYLELLQVLISITDLDKEKFTQAIKNMGIVNMGRVVYDFMNVATNLVVLIDLSDTRGYNEKQHASLNSVLCLSSQFRSIVAHSSGSGSFLPFNSAAHRILSDYKKRSPRVKYVPFDDKQAATFLRESPPVIVNVISNSELKNLTGFNPSLMVAYVNAQEKANVTEVIMSEVNSFVNSIVPTLKDDCIYWVRKNLPICNKFLNYAANECDIPICDLDEYITSWIHTESITFILEQSAENFKLAVNFPPIIYFLMSLFKSKSHFKSSIVDGLVFEDAICRDIGTLYIRYSSQTSDIKSAKFTISAPSQQKIALQKIYPGILYRLRDFHPTIDAIGCFIDEEDAERSIWLVMIQISLSTYSEQKSKATDLFKSTVGSEKKIDDSCNLLNYYRKRILDATDSKKCINPEVIQCMYVYISPKEFFSQTNPSDILGGVGQHNDTKDLYFGLVHDQTDTGHFITDTYIAL